MPEREIIEGVTPYYHDAEAGIAVYCGDCRELLPLIPEGLVLITDPPYGIACGSADQRGGVHGLAKRAYEGLYTDTYEAFRDDIVPRIGMALDRTIRAAVWTGPHIHEQRKPACMGGIYCPASTGRHAWGFKQFLPVLLYGVAPHVEAGNGAHHPTAISSSERATPSGHPCPKPLAWMVWLVKLASYESDIVLDPFAGSGTTLVACKTLGRLAIGIEIEERYCEIAANRLRQGVFDWSKGD